MLGLPCTNHAAWDGQGYAAALLLNYGAAFEAKTNVSAFRVYMGARMRASEMTRHWLLFVRSF